MPVRKAKPTSPGRRFQSHSDYAEVTRSAPEKSLVRPKPAKVGRNNYGRITTRHRGAGNKARYRVIDFRRNKDGVPARVAHVEYDPNRNARIALLHYADGEKRYILMPHRLRVGDVVESGSSADIQVGNALPLRNIPVGTVVHNVELKPGAGGKMARSAGSSVQLVAKEGTMATLRLPSGETRGVAMNPVDHPLGGGEGKSSGGRHPSTPWGKKEGRTRRRKSSDALIVRRRGKKRGR